MDQGLHRRQQQRRAEPTDDRPEDDDRGQTLGEGHRQGADRVAEQTQHVGLLAADQVADLAADQDERGRHQRLQRDRRLHPADRGVQVLDHRGDRHVHQRGVHDEHEHRHGQQDRQPPIQRGLHRAATVRLLRHPRFLSDAWVRSSAGDARSGDTVPPDRGAQGALPCGRGHSLPADPHPGSESGKFDHVSSGANSCTFCTLNTAPGPSTSSACRSAQCRITSMGGATGKGRRHHGSDRPATTKPESFCCGPAWPSVRHAMSPARPRSPCGPACPATPTGLPDALLGHVLNSRRFGASMLVLVGRRRRDRGRVTRCASISTTGRTRDGGSIC